MTASGSRALCLCAIALMLGSCKDRSDYTGWRVSGGSKKAQHYSSLTQIDSNNVGQLQVAWEYHTKDADDKNHSQIQCSPIVVDGILYGTTPRVRLFAVDNTSQPPRTQMNDQNFEFYLPEGAQVDSSFAQTEGGQAVNSAPVPQTERNQPRSRLL